MRVTAFIATLGVGCGVGQIPAPVGDKLFPVGKQFVDDFDDAFVLEEVVVLVVTEEGEPGFEGQLVAGKTAVGTK